MNPEKLKIENYTDKPIEDMQAPNYDLSKHVVDSIHDDFKNQFGDYVIEGLKRKGFEFKHPLDLEAFVKERCRCEDNIDIKERVYFVDDIPFFLYNYKWEIITEIHPNKFIGEFGTFAYL